MKTHVSRLDFVTLLLLPSKQLRKQEAKTGVAAAEAAQVKLYCQVPAITKLDSSLATLANCEYVLPMNWRPSVVRPEYESNQPQTTGGSRSPRTRSTAWSLWTACASSASSPSVETRSKRSGTSLALAHRVVQYDLPCMAWLTLPPRDAMHRARTHIQIEKLEDVAESLEELWLSYNLITSLDGLGALSKLTTLYMSNNHIKAWAELDKLVRVTDCRCLSVCLSGAQGRIIRSRPRHSHSYMHTHVATNMTQNRTGGPAQPAGRALRGEPHLRGPLQRGG